MSSLEIIRPRRMSWQRRLAESIRAYWQGPWKSSDHEILGYMGRPTGASGVAVNEWSSLSYAAVWNAVWLISSHVGQLPLAFYRRLPNGGKEKFITHPLYRLLHDEPNPEMSSMVFRQTLQAHVLLWGNAYAEIERDNGGRPVALWPLTPNACMPYRAASDAALRYKVINPNGQEITFPARDILHVAGLGFDGVCGYSVIAKARESIGLGMAAEQFGATFFGNGSTFGGVLSHPGFMTVQAKEDLKASIQSQHQGVDRAHRFLLLQEGLKYERMGIPPNDAQFLETRKFQVEDVARWFNVPVHKLKDLERSTNNNIEHQSIEYVQDTLQPWLTVWEQELNRKLIAKLEQRLQLFEHVTLGLLKGDAATRGEYYGKQFNIGAITQNEIRERENLNPITGGDVPFVPMNMIPVDLARDYWEAQIKKANEPTPAPMVPKETDAESDERHEALVTLTRQALQAAEDGRDFAIAELEKARAEIQRLEDEADAERLKSEAALAEAQSAIDDMRQAHAEEVERHAATKLEMDEHLSERERLQSELVALGESHGLAVASLQARRDELQATVDALETQRAELAGKFDSAAKALESLTQATQGLQSTIEQQDADARDKAAKYQAEIEDGVNRLRASDVELAVAKGQLDALRDVHETYVASVESLQAQKSAAMVAVRTLLIEAVSRLLQKEMDRARKNQSTPEKLRKWVDQFYPVHLLTCRTTLQPVVSAWAVLTQQDAGVLLDRLVDEHVETSILAFRQVLDSDDDDQMAMALERLLRRWDTERATAVADALLKG